LKSSISPAVETGRLATCQLGRGKTGLGLSTGVAGRTERKSEGGTKEQGRTGRTGRTRAWHASAIAAFFGNSSSLTWPEVALAMGMQHYTHRFVQ